MILRKTFSATALAILVACSSTPVSRIDIAPVGSDLRLNAVVGSAMVRSISLPSYAAAEEVSFETAEGLITSSETLLWADEPARAITLTIARHLDAILTANVGPDPWPFIGLPDVGIDIRVTRMIAGGDGNFALEGQYYVGGDGIDYPNQTATFAISKPLISAEQSAIAFAQAQALLELSEQIARRLGR